MNALDGPGRAEPAARGLLGVSGMLSQSKLRSALRDQRGQILIEYLAVLFIVGLGLVLVAGPLVGPRLTEEYARRMALLYSPYP